MFRGAFAELLRQIHEQERAYWQKLYDDAVEHVESERRRGIVQPPPRVYGKAGSRYIREDGEIYIVE